MSWEKHDDDCPGCRPAILDVRTGKALPPDDPIMRAVNAVWAQTTLAERQAFHRVCCENSRDQADLDICFALNERFKAAMPESQVESAANMLDDIIVWLPGEPPDLADEIARRTGAWLRQHKGLEVAHEPVLSEEHGRQYMLRITRPEGCSLDQERHLMSLVGHVALKIHKKICEEEGESP